MTTQEEQDQINSRFWKAVVARAKEADEAYAAVVKASDALADVAKQSKEIALRFVLPKDTMQRRESGRALQWVMQERDSIINQFEESERSRKKREARAALMEKLKLSAEEMDLLGIQ